jgi:hypothetical protein
LASYSPDSKVKLKVPSLDCDDAEITSYVDLAFGKRNTLRNTRLQNVARNFLYYYGRQWIELDRPILYQGSRGFAFKDIAKPYDDAPRPVTNEVAQGVRGEYAALTRRKLTANVQTRSRDPRIEAAAKVSKDILADRLKKLDWREKRDHFTFVCIIAGLAVLKSYWDETISDVGFYDNPDAVGCECGTTVASQAVDKKLIADTELESAKFEELDSDNVYLKACPTCPDDKPLTPLTLDQELAASSDYFGRPLGTVIPKGQTAIEVVSPFDFYPDNSGIDVEWNSMKVWRQATPRTIDWVLERYPELENQIEPDDPATLMEFHPILGDWNIRGRYDSQLDADLFANHVIVYEIYSEKSYRFPNGRAIVVVGDKSKVVAKNGELYRQGIGKNQVALVKYAGANWEHKHKEIWGKSLVDDLISPQNRVNGLDALEIESIGRMGTPNIILPEDSRTDSPEFFEQYGIAKVIRYSINPLNPSAKPEVMGGVGMPANVQMAREAALESLRRFAGPTDVQLGDAPKNVGTTSGLRFLDEKADALREPHERNLIVAFEKIWSHQLELLWNLRVEPDSYEAETEDGSWEMRQYDRMALMGQTKVEIEKQSEVDKSLYQSEAVREAMADMLYGPVEMLSLHARQRLLELRGLPTDVNEDVNYQIEGVKKAWVDFMESGAIPTIDLSLDNPLIKYQGLATYLMSPEGVRIAEQVQWNQVLKKIPQSVWLPKLMQAEQMDMVARQTYPDPMMAQEQYAMMQQQHQQSMMAWEAQQKSAQAVAGDPQAMAAGGPVAMPAPQPPPPPAFLPGDKADHIYAVWMQILNQDLQMQAMQQQMAGMPQPMMQAPQFKASPQLDSYMKFRAVVEAYRLLAGEGYQPVMGVAPAGTQQGAPGMLGGTDQVGADAMGGVPSIEQLNVRQSV